jgi:putative chitinase
LDSICPKYGIDTPDKFHEFIARLCVECGEFKVFEENLNYSVQGLLSTFSRNRISDQDCRRLGRHADLPADKQHIANIIYGGEWGKKNLGNTQEGDGWLFRGSGPMQLTGRSNVTNFTSYYNIHFGTSFTPEAMADMLRTNIEIGIHAACWIFAISFKLLQYAVDDKLEAIVKRINGGLNGLEETKKYYERAKSVIT